jgi:diacylglycerol kinase (ATP)
MSSVTPRVRVILNPSAAAGTAAKRLSRLSAAMLRCGLGEDIVLTRGPGHATRLAEQARKDRVDVLAVAGGDGTLSEVAQAYVDDAGAAKAGPELALLPLGTGGDFRKTLGIPKHLEEAVERLRDGRAQAVDLGLLEFQGAVNGARRRAFINVASFGLGGTVDELVNRGPKWIGGRASFFVATLRALPTYRAPRVRVDLDGRTIFEGRIMNVCMANGRYFGGGMFIAPEARLDDGRFDVVIIEERSMVGSLAMGLPLYRGKHGTMPGIHTARGAVLEATALEAGEPVRFDVDGETLGALPARVSVLPAALSMRV